MVVLILYNIIRKCILTLQYTLKPKFIVMCCISLNTHIIQSLFKFKIFIIKIPKDSPFILLVLNAVFINVYHVKAVQDDIPVKTVSI